MDKQKPSKGYGKYGKRPIWQWILLYLLIGGVIYFVVYLLFSKDSGGGGIY